ncbi:MAG TPA: FlgO family outer membrane protein [Leptospiraceae bacterium]|nr:FlgO family outer membrane protein [Leptospiraceae bacterium]
MKYTLISLLLLAFFYCKSISHKSSSDEIIDYSAKKISKEILSNYIEKEKKTIGVATFSKEDLEDKQVNTLGLFLANSIHNEMFNPARYDLVERTQIDKLVDEFKSYQNGLYSESDTKKLSLHGVDYLLLGSLQKRQDTIRINARLVSVQTGKIVSIASEAIPINNSIISLYELENSNKNSEMNKGKKTNSSVIISRETEKGLIPSKAFFLDDKIFFSYQQSNSFDTTRVELGFSECQKGIYYRKSFDINSSWTGFGYPADTTMSLNDFLTDYNNVNLPNSYCFDISFIVKDMTSQITTIHIDKRKFKNKYFENYEDE